MKIYFVVWLCVVYLVWSVRRASQRLRTSGRGNSCSQKSKIFLSITNPPSSLFLCNFSATWERRRESQRKAKYCILIPCNGEKLELSVGGNLLNNGGKLQSGDRRILCSFRKPVRWECLQRPGPPPSTWWVGGWSKDLEKKKSASCSDQLGPTCLQVSPLWLGFHWQNHLRSWWRSPWIGNDYYE